MQPVTIGIGPSAIQHTTPPSPDRSDRSQQSANMPQHTPAPQSWVGSTVRIACPFFAVFFDRPVISCICWHIQRSWHSTEICRFMLQDCAYISLSLVSCRKKNLLDTITNLPPIFKTITPSLHWGLKVTRFSVTKVCSDSTVLMQWQL